MKLLPSGWLAGDRSDRRLGELMKDWRPGVSVPRGTTHLGPVLACKTQNNLCSQFYFLILKFSSCERSADIGYNESRWGSQIQFMRIADYRSIALRRHGTLRKHVQTDNGLAQTLLREIPIRKWLGRRNRTLTGTRHQDQPIRRASICNSARPGSWLG